MLLRMETWILQSAIALAIWLCLTTQSSSQQNDVFRVESVGNEIKFSTSSVNQRAIFLVGSPIEHEGTVYAFSTWFRLTNRARFQIWRPTSPDAADRKYQLLGEVTVDPSVTGQREDVYIEGLLSQNCVRTKPGDRLGVYLEVAPGSVAYTFTPTNPMALSYIQTGNTTKTVEINETITFDSLSFPYDFSLMGFIDVLGRSDGSDYDVRNGCPKGLLIPPYGDALIPSTTTTPIPTGAPGATGATGPQGPQGVPGAVGPAGPLGPVGPQGAQGAPGFDGVNGIDGLNGKAGAEGLPGLAGSTGATGNMGWTGSTGPMGPEGLPGTNGFDGFTGATGPIGLMGATGFTGDPGPPGQVGLIGPPGPIGLSGMAGRVGPPGLPGQPGQDGQPGRDGKDGLPGTCSATCIEATLPPTLPPTTTTTTTQTTSTTMSTSMKTTPGSGSGGDMSKTEAPGDDDPDDPRAGPVSATEDSFWSSELLSMILLIWLIVVTIFIIIHSICLCCLLCTKRRKRQSLKYKYKGYFDGPGMATGLDPVDKPSTRHPQNVSRNSSFHDSKPDWMNTLASEETKEYHIDTITRENSKRGRYPSSDPNGTDSAFASEHGNGNLYEQTGVY